MSDDEQKPRKVTIRFDRTGRTMECSRAAFDREYAKAGWSLVETPAVTEPAEGDEPVKKAAKKPAKKSTPAAGGAGD